MSETSADGSGRTDCATSAGFIGGILSAQVPKSSGRHMLRGHWLPVPRRREKRGGKRQRESLVVSHGRPVRSRGLHPLPTCQNEGYPRSLYHPNLTPIMVKVWLPKGILAAANAAAGPREAVKQ